MSSTDLQLIEMTDELREILGFELKALTVDQKLGQFAENEFFSYNNPVDGSHDVYVTEPAKNFVKGFGSVN